MLSKYWPKYGKALFLILLSCVFVTLFSVTTSPIWNLSDTQDSYVYYLIGKYWTQGFLPYVDLWDQKGPVIYFINAVGHSLTESLTGVFLIQLIFMIATAFGIFRLYRIQWNNLQSLAGVVFSFVCLFSLYEDGNMVEEYLLPLLLWCLIGQYQWVNRYVEKDEVQHQPTHAFIYGLTLGFCLLTRLTNALGVCGGVAFIAATLLVHRQYRNLAYNALTFIGGFCVLTMPLILYFYHHGAFDEMWYGTFLFNMSYAANSGHGLTTFIHRLFLRNYIDIYAFLVIGVFIMLFVKRRRMVGLWMLSASVLIWFWLISSAGFSHYGIICIPYSCITLLEACSILRCHSSSLLKIATDGVIVIYLFIIVGKDVNSANNLLTNDKKSGQTQVDHLMTFVPAEDYNAFITYDTTPYCYLRYNIRPCYKYFTCQNYTMSMNVIHHDKVMKEFNSCKAKWILMERKHGINKYIDSILHTYYELIATAGDFQLYHLLVAP